MDLKNLSDDQLSALEKSQTTPLSEMTDQELTHLEDAHTIQRGRDIIKSIAIAPANVATGLAGLPGTIRNLVSQGFSALGQAGGVPEESTQTVKDYAAKAMPGIGYYPDPASIQQFVEKGTGPFYKPQTLAGERANVVAQGAVGALAAPYELGPTLATAVPKVLMQGLSRLGIGTATGAGSRAAEEAAPEGYKTAAGLAGGLVTGGVASMAPSLLSTARNYMAASGAGANIGREIGGRPVSVGSVRNLAADVAADRLTPTDVAATTAALGPEARLLDAGRQLKQTAAVGLARMPGEGQSNLLNVIEGRTGIRKPTGEYKTGEASAARLNPEFDTAMGTPVQDMVKYGENISNTYGPPTRRAYNDVMAKHPFIDVPADITSRPVIETSMANALRMAKNYGAGVVPEKSLQYWDYVKRGIDARINSLMKHGTDPQSGIDSADLGGLMESKRALTNFLDQHTIDPTSGISGYKAARQLSATQKGIEDAADFGKAVFNNNARSEDVIAHFNDMSLAEQTMAKASIRRELSQRMGSVGNDALKARQLFDQNNVTDKVAGIFGTKAASMIENGINRENAFQAVTDMTKGSVTSAAQQRIKRIEGGPPPDLPSVPTVYGALTYPFRASSAYLHGQGTARTQEDMARILLAKQGQIDPVIQQLLNYNQRTAANAPTPASSQAGAVIRALMAQRAAGG